MSRILPSTLLQQQSFNPEWVISDELVPTGVVISCQFTTVSSDPITLSSLSVRNRVLTIVFSQGGNICASITTQRSGVYPLVVYGGVLSATLEVGIIPPEDVVFNFSDAVINDLYVNIVATYKATPGRLTITQDGDATDYEVTSDINLVIDRRLTTQYDDVTRALTISMPADDYLSFLQLGNSVLMPESEISTINGVRSKNGVITIDIYNEGALVPVNCMESNWVELKNSDGISFCPGAVEALDLYIAPSTHAGYFPLDDAYNEKGVRDTELLLANSAQIYGGFTGGMQVQLMQVDPTIDVIKKEN